MYSDKENINILTALLIAHNVRKAVVCPGSRNAPIVHNLNECREIECIPVTDERSAGFYAIGMAQATDRPVVVCVTSGTALLNLAPAVAEAFYQHIPLIVISADRPAAWINQLDGQTLPQPNALGHFVRKSVSLPEPKDETERWMCNRMVNEALHLATYRQAAPVHINVPISEPLFNFTTNSLPKERVFNALPIPYTYNYTPIIERIQSVERPMIVIGQMKRTALEVNVIEELEKEIVVLREPLSTNSDSIIHFDEVIHAIGTNKNYMPDTILYIGDTVVSKRTRKFLRLAKAETIFATPNTSNVADPLMNMTAIVEYNDPNELLRALLHGHTANNATMSQRNTFSSLWEQALNKAKEQSECFEPEYSQMATVKYFEEQLEDIDYNVCVHYANSSSIRLANIFAKHYVWCNRGVNGIEGSLSTAAGFSLATDNTVFCVIGDLSFFYDQNALWNARLRGNFRVLLLNNGCGGIFHQLQGLDKSSAYNTLVAASHDTNARGICTQNDIGYICATTMQEAKLGIIRLLTEQTKRPMVLEVFTGVNDDVKVLNDYYNNLKI